MATTASRTPATPDDPCATNAIADTARLNGQGADAVGGACDNFRFGPTTYEPALRSPSGDDPAL